MFAVGRVRDAASWLLKNKGRFFAVFRAERAAEFPASTTGGGIEPKRLRFARSRAGEKAGLFLVEGLKGGGTGLTVEPPLYVYGEDGEYTSDLLEAYELKGLAVYGFASGSR